MEKNNKNKKHSENNNNTNADNKKNNNANMKTIRITRRIIMIRSMTIRRNNRNKQNRITYDIQIIGVLT